MKLPEDIERELLDIETALGAWSGQQAGFPKLRGLRGAIERHMADLAAARAVLDLSGSGTGFGNRMIVVDDAKWQAWQARAGKGQG